MTAADAWSVAFASGELAAREYDGIMVPWLFDPWADVLLDYVKPGAGEARLDVACGTGSVTRRAAGRVGPDVVTCQHGLQFFGPARYVRAAERLSVLGIAPGTVRCTVPVMPGIEVRGAVPADLSQIAAVALATGQDEEWAGSDPSYMAHLLRYGSVVVGVAGGSVIGFGATRRLGSGQGAVSMLCDLFVDPARHGSGCGRAMLAELWPGRGRRMTFSSLHGHALPLYTSFGLDAWWPLLYLRGRVKALATPAGWRAEAAEAAEVAALELAWTGVDRSGDHLAWARRPGGAGVLARHDGRVTAAGTVGGAGSGYGVTHLALAPSAGDADSACAVLAVLASLEPADGRACVCLPGPHPAVRALLAAGWRVEDFDLYMATTPGLLDPRRAVPSPALA